MPSLMYLPRWLFLPHMQDTRLKQKRKMQKEKPSKHRSKNKSEIICSIIKQLRAFIIFLEPAKAGKKKCLLHRKITLHKRNKRNISILKVLNRIYYFIFCYIRKPLPWLPTDLRGKHSRMATGGCVGWEGNEDLLKQKSSR